MLPDACLFLHSTRSAAKSKGKLDAIVIRCCCTPYRLAKVKKTKKNSQITQTIYGLLCQFMFQKNQCSLLSL
jgi:hypothetical protein